MSEITSANLTIIITSAQIIRSVVPFFGNFLEHDMHKNLKNIEPDLAEIARAWDYHASADALLHQRLQSFFSSQSILLVSTFVAIQSDKIPFFIQSLLPFLGLCTCYIFKNLMDHPSMGLERLKEIYLCKDRPYFIYLFDPNKYDEDYESHFQRRKRKLKPKLVPRFSPYLFSIIWIILLAYILSDWADIELSDWVKMLKFW